MRLAVFTHVIHYQQAGRFYAYSPYVREMNLWFKEVDEVEVISPRAPGGGDLNFGKAYEHKEIIFTSIPVFNLLSILSVLKSIFKIPIIFIKILHAMQRADHLHLRCPGNIGLLAAIAQMFFPKKPKTVKYAGNWDPKSKQPWTYKLQKKILNKTFITKNIKVLVYGVWPDQSDNILPFFTASFSAKDKEPIHKDFSPPYKLIFTGNLVEGKGVFEAIELIETLNKQGVKSELEIYGDGILKDSLNNYIQKKDLQKLVKLKGRKSLEELKGAYKKAHFVILLSNSEGWPKTVAEGMWYGCIPIATPVSCVPWMLDYGSRGILIQDLEKGKKSRENKTDVVESGEWRVNSRSVLEETVKRIIELIKDREESGRMSLAAQEWSQHYTLEKFKKAIQEILRNGIRHPKPQTLNFDSYKGDNPQPITDNSQQTTHNPKHLRVLQLIDSLNPGGAERMAVNIANVLAEELEASYLCTTREEGMLKKELGDGVGFLFLNKKHSLDLCALKRLRTFIKEEKIEIIHAHGTSWFLGVLLKIIGTKVILVWHDHYGNRLKNKRMNLALIYSSVYFDGVLVLSEELKKWTLKNLKSQHVIKLPNFILNKNRLHLQNKRKHDKRFIIVNVANLRQPKNHLNLLKAFRNFSKKESNIFLRLIGNDYRDNYSSKLKMFIERNSLTEKVEIISGTTEVMPYLNNADLAVLSSDWEALPLSILEYGLSGLPVISTNVGECPEILKNRGILVTPGKVGALEKAIIEYYDNPLKRKEDAQALHLHIKNNYTRAAVLPKLIGFYDRLRGGKGNGQK
ncbi:glycosyltransferase [Zunongwangia sp. F260]|uniref:Glycosyltransferase n=1 Tax=Autumnicola lenta TaxID=3075593 RepID=A0ABU3CG89_9FLAO|nr:glycosyltransferase [Zunongwangia sp. F260]MDT0645301.1 glycosyltransferase [Zunongwangia sp. F260]